MRTIGIVIVTYNSAPHIGPCLDAALATGAEVVVVDNCSSDDTVKEVEHRGVHCVANSDNLGFAAAVNQGFHALNTTYVLVLNPDAVIVAGLNAMAEASSLPRSAGASGRLVSPDGHPQTGFMVRNLPTPASMILETLLLNRLWPNNPINRRYRCLGFDGSERVEVEQPAGAFLMLRHDVWRELGGFDEKFWPLWFEDVDFCRRLADRGYLLYFEPLAVAKHTGAHSISNLSLEMRRVCWYRSLLRYSAKHFRRGEFRAVCLAVILGSLPRLIADLALHRNLVPLAAFRKVVRLASRCLVCGWRDDVVFSGPQ